jgi:hypothetical protein
MPGDATISRDRHVESDAVGWPFGGEKGRSEQMTQARGMAAGPVREALSRTIVR